MPSQTEERPDFMRETRVGIVVYGGVSLAIYMNGVCREFYNAVRGRGIYKLVKALIDSDIVVDIISGTSAGGINGVLLGYALANSDENKFIEFADFARIWRESGNIQKLMHQPSRSVDREKNSVLDGENYYQTQLANAFADAEKNKKYNKLPVKCEWYSRSNELDLFVTGTDVLGRFYKVFDDTGSVLEIKNHRAIFQLKHRQGRKEPFNPYFKTENQSPQSSDPQATYEALAKLCRITSCFPVAFPVVEVKLKTEDEVEQKLVEWGQLDSRELPETPPEGGYKLYFVDGGVLENHPFSYTIKEMYYRTGIRPVDRKLFYVDPSPDRFEENRKFKDMPKPDVLEVLQDSLIGLPTYQSISNDLELIKEHNEKVRRYKFFLKNVEDAQHYNDVASQDQEEIYLLTRVISLRDRVLPLVLRMESDRTTDDDENQAVSKDKKQGVLEKTAKILAQRITDGKPNDRKEIWRKAGKQLQNLDVEYALRKHFYFLQKLCQVLDKVRDDESGNYKRVQLLIGILHRLIKLLEVIREAIDMLLSNPIVSNSFYSLLDQGNPDKDAEDSNNKMRADFYDRLLGLHRFLLDSEQLEKFLTPEAQKDYEEKVPQRFFAELSSISTKSFQELILKSENLSSEYEATQKIGKFNLEAETKKWLSQPMIALILDKLKQKINTIDKQSIEGIGKPSNLAAPNEGANFSSILSKIEEASEALIKASELHKDSTIRGLFENIRKPDASSNRESDDGNPILDYFQQFRQLDQVLYPFEYLTDIKEKELIQTIRISPNDAQMGLGYGKKLDEKLAGNTLRAFGGFFKKSWRSNDILWGRLDGLNRIVEGLVTRESLENFQNFIAREVKDKPEQYWEELLVDCFPNSQPDDRNEIKEDLLKLAEGNVSDFDIQAFLKKLVLEGHRDILITEIQNVVEDAISEQLEWNQQRVTAAPGEEKVTLTKPESNEKPKYQPVSGYFDKTVTTLAATELAKNAIGTLSWQDKENFFRHQYKVGSEKLLEDIPTGVLLAIATRFTLVLREVLVPLLGASRSEQLRKNPIYQIFSNLLHLFYWLLQTNPGFSRYKRIILTLWIAFFVIAVVGVVATLSKSFWSVAIALGAFALCWFLGWLLEEPWKKTDKNGPSRT